MQTKLLQLQGEVAGVRSDAAAQAADAVAAQAQAADATVRANAAAAELQHLRGLRGDQDSRTAGLKMQLDEARDKLSAAEGALASAVHDKQVSTPQLCWSCPPRARALS